MNTFVCTRCEGTGFLNLHQVDEATLMKFDDLHDAQVILDWIADRDARGRDGCCCAAMRMPPCHYCTDIAHDVRVCDCCDGIGRHDWDNPHDPKGCR